MKTHIESTQYGWYFIKYSNRFEGLLTGNQKFGSGLERKIGRRTEVITSILGPLFFSQTFDFQKDFIYVPWYLISHLPLKI